MKVFSQLVEFEEVPLIFRLWLDLTFFYGKNYDNSFGMVFSQQFLQTDPVLARAAVTECHSLGGF